MKKQNAETIATVHTHTHTHTPVFYKNINKKASLLNKISFVMHEKNQIKENIKIGYYMM